MAEEIGRAEVQFPDHTATFDSVAILPNSTLRVANLHQQRSPFMERMPAEARNALWTLGEHDVQYFPAGSWLSVERLEESGSLISALSTRYGDSSWSLSGDRVVYRTIGDRLTWKEAVTALRQELSAMGVTDSATVERHCETLTYRGATDFIPLALPKYALYRRLWAMDRWFGRQKGKPGRRRGVVFSFVISPEPGAGQNFTLNTTNFPGLSLIKGSS